MMNEEQMAEEFAEQQIPMDDVSAWEAYPNLRWVYDKTKLADLEGLKWGPAGLMPDEFPVFNKPMMNLYGMGEGTMFISNEKEMKKNYIPGTFWTEVLDGEHYSFDVPVVNGEIKDYLIGIGAPGPHRRFNYWRIKRTNPDCDYIKQKSKIVEFVQTYLQDYVGMVNFEMISTTIIEVHLRGSLHFFPVWEGIDNCIKVLYEQRYWKRTWRSGPDCFIVPIWADKFQKFDINWDVIRDIRTRAKVTIDYNPDVPSYEYANPPKSFRIGTVFGDDLDITLDRAKKIRAAFT